MKLSVWAWCLSIAAGAVWAAPCPGDSDVLAEYLFGEGGGYESMNTGADGEAGTVWLQHGAAFDAETPWVNSCGWSIYFPNSGSGHTTPAVESAEVYEPLYGADAFTIMAWVRRESGDNKSNTSARIVSAINSHALTNTTEGVEFRFSGAAGNLALRVNGVEVSSTAASIPPDGGEWVHVAVVYDGLRPATNANTRNVHFYVDGVQKGQGNVLQGEVVGANSNYLTIGNASVNRSIANTMVGCMDDVLILDGFAPDAVGNGKTNEAIRCFMMMNDDIEPPLITAPPDVTAYAGEGLSPATGVDLGTPVASDNCALGNVTNNAPHGFPMGVTPVVWTAEDEAGLTASAVQWVSVYASPLLDSDGDGLTDWEELMVYESNPLLSSTADDGYNDGWKVQNGLDPATPMDSTCRPAYW